MDPMDVAKRLDHERVEIDPYVDPTHWQDWLTFTERRAKERAQAREAAAERPSAHRTRSEQDARAQMARPQRHAQGMAALDPDHPDDQIRVQVIDLADRERLIVRKLDDPDASQYLIYDAQFDDGRDVRNLDDLTAYPDQPQTSGGEDR